MSIPAALVDAVISFSQDDNDAATEALFSANPLSKVSKIAQGVRKGVSSVTKGSGKSAHTPVGRSGQQVNFPNSNAPKPRNAPETIRGRDFSGHAIDRIQERGYTPSVIENALQVGTRSAGNKPNTSVFTDSPNNLRVIINSESGRVITVVPGGG